MMNVPQMSIVYRTPLVHQNMTKKTTFYERKKGEITYLKCKVGLWFLSTEFPLITINVPRHG